MPPPSTPLSSTEEHTSSAREMVEEFFNWKPVASKAAVDHTKSASSGAPKFWDRHLHPSLILKRVKYLPSIKTGLKKAALDALDAMPVIPEINEWDDAFPTPDYRTRRTEINIRDEASLIVQYQTTIADFCTRVASTLFFRLDSWKSRVLFEWSVSSSNPRNHANADAFLRPVPLSTHKFPYLSSWTAAINNLLAKFSNTAVWEFKSLKLGTEGAIDLLLEFSTIPGDFPWIGCEQKGQCQYVHGEHSDTDTAPVTGGRAGFDCGAGVLPFDLTDVVQWSSAPVKVKKTARRSMHHFVQQGWAQAVRNDATFLVFRAGNFEVIGVRHRATQTLYLTDVIEVSKERGYGQLQTGLYISIIAEGIARAQQISATMPARMPASWTRHYDKEPAADEIIQSKHSGLSSADRQEEDVKFHQDMLRAIHSRPIVVFSLEKKNPDFSPPFLVAKPYHRLNWSEDINSKPDFRMNRIMVTPREVSALVCRGKIRVDGQDFNPMKSQYLRDKIPFPTDVIIKNAHSPLQRETLRTEWDFYQDMAPHRVKGVPLAVGYFVHDEAEGSSWSALILPDAGIEVVVEELSNKDRTTFRETLHGIHKLYLHGNLNPKKLLVTADGQLSIVGYGRALSVRNFTDAVIAAEKIREIQELDTILAGRYAEPPRKKRRILSSDHISEGTSERVSHSYCLYIDHLQPCDYEGVDPHQIVLNLTGFLMTDSVTIISEIRDAIRGARMEERRGGKSLRLDFKYKTLLNEFVNLYKSTPMSYGCKVEVVE